jgi:hypothetical protein
MKRMTTTVQKTTLAMAAAVIAIAVLGYAMLASPVTAQTATSTTTSPATPALRTQTSGPTTGPRANHGGPFQRGAPMMGKAWARDFVQNQVNVSVGQTFTITSTQGKYYVPGSPSSNGTASGTVTFTVTGKLSAGYTLSVTGGSVTVAGTTYTISSGTAQMNRGASAITGQGVTSPTGEFLLRATARGSFVGSTGLVSLDLQSGSSEYLVVLAGSIQS